MGRLQDNTGITASRPHWRAASFSAYARCFSRACAALAVAVSFAAPVLAAKHPPNIEQIQISIDGEFKGAVESYSSKNSLFVDARETAKIMDGSAVSSRGSIELRFKKFKVKLKDGSKQAIYDGGAPKTLPAAVVMRDGRPFAPVALFTDPAFCSALQRRVTYNDTAKSLDLEKFWQVGETDFSSYGLMTTLSFELRDVAGYTTVKDGARLDILIARAVAQTYETISIDDGIIRTVAVAENGDGVKISINMADAKSPWTVSRDSVTLSVQISKAGSEKAVSPDSDTTSDDSDSDTPSPPPAKPAAKTAAKTTSSKGLETTATIQHRLNIPDSIMVDGHSGKRLIVIDAGHGGKDPGGSKRHGVVEKNLNLSTAKELAALFRDNKMFDAVLTRSTDYFIPLSGRSAIANDRHADVFVSIHANANNHKSERGFEVYFMSESATDPWAKHVAAMENASDPEDERAVPEEGILLHSLARVEYMNESAVLAGFVSKELSKRSPIKDRGVKQAPFYVLRGTYSPAVLVETGFMTNPKDAALLSKSEMRKKIAQGIYDGVMSYAKSKGWDKVKQ